ncbi:MAG: helix-turn-helix transcriptional regulator [Bdellovibrionales bacterium]
MPRVKKTYDDKKLEKLVKNVGVMLKFYRERADLSQNKLAKASGVSISTINEIENLVVNDVRLSTVSTLARHLKVDPLALIVPSDFSISDGDTKEFKKAYKLLDKIYRRII